MIMHYEPVEFKLRDGRTAILKNPEEQDAQGLIDYLVKSSGETDFVIRYPEECERYTLESEIKLIAEMKESENDAFLTCTVDGKVAGNCHLMMNDRMKMHHRAFVAIALLQEFWNLGIGSFMFSEMLRIAKERGDIEQVELEVVDGNERGIALYKKMGFVEYGRRPNAMHTKDGRSLDEILMMRKL